MEDILKYHRFQNLERVWAQGPVTVCSLESNYLVFGGESGHIHIVNFAGQIIQKLKPHEGAVRSIALYNDSTALTVVSCGDDGKVATTIISSTEVKESSITVGEPLTAICIYNKAITNSKRNSIGSSSASSSSSTNNPNNLPGSTLIFGTSKGVLYYHRPSWFSHKNSILYPGDGLPIVSLSISEPLLAFSDGQSVRILNVKDQQALWQIPAPIGVCPINDPYPPVLCWIKPAQKLVIAWADSFKVLEIKESIDEDEDISAKISSDWTSDTIICGVQPLDNDHVILVGYSPLPEENNSQIPIPESDEMSDEESEDDVKLTSDNNTFSLNNNPEIIIARTQTGEIISADQLNLRGANFLGPWAYKLLSSNSISMSENNPWSLDNERNLSDSNKKNSTSSPIFFLVSPTDFICARVRTIDDRIMAALSRKQLQLACNIAYRSRQQLNKISYSKLLTLYLDFLYQQSVYYQLNPTQIYYHHNHLVNSNNLNINNTNQILVINTQFLASECVRLLPPDLNLWAEWINKFIEWDLEQEIGPLVPTSKPILMKETYYKILESCLEKEKFDIFLDLIKKWCKINGNKELFDRNMLIDRLLALKKQLVQDKALKFQSTSLINSSISAPSSSSNKPTGNKSELSAMTDLKKFSVYLEALAHLYLSQNQLNQVLDLYLASDLDKIFSDQDYNHLNNDPHSVYYELSELSNYLNQTSSSTLSLAGLLSNIKSTATSSTESTPYLDRYLNHGREYKHVFELIEKQYHANNNKSSLNSNKVKIKNLINLSRPLAGSFLLSNIDRYPIHSVVQALNNDDRLLLWYLHLLFIDPIAREIYSKVEYSEIHIRHLKLYADFAPPFVKPEFQPEDDLNTKSRIFNSILLNFMRSGLISMKDALPICEEKKLYPEIIFAKCQLNKKTESLLLLLREISDIDLAIAFIEEQFHTANSPIINSNANNTNLNTTASNDIQDYMYTSAIEQEQELWNALISYVTTPQPNCQPNNPLPLLADLIDAIGSCKIDPVQLLAQIPKDVSIPLLRQRLCGLIQDMKSIKTYSEYSKSALEQDARLLIMKKNFGQRKAIRIDTQLRCSACMKLLVLESSGQVSDDSLLTIPKDQIQIWGPNSNSGAVILSNKLAFHKICYKSLK